jgi:membrane protein implicated in regulation of membrane protease activity
MSAWTVWLLAGLALAIAEALLPGAFLIWIGIAAAGTGLVTLAADLRFELQVIAFAVLAAGALTTGLRLRRHRPVLNTRHAGLAGRTATALAFRGREGGSVWATAIGRRGYRRTPPNPRPAPCCAWWMSTAPC